MDTHQPDVANLDFVESLYQQYLQDPTSVDPQWQAMFASWTNGEAGTDREPKAVNRDNPRRSIFHAPESHASLNGNGTDNGTHNNGHHASLTESAKARPDRSEPVSIPELPKTPDNALDDSVLQHKVDLLIRNYRVRGHIAATFNPLKETRELPDEMDPAYHGFTEADLDKPFYTSTLPGNSQRTLREILKQLQETYCRDVGSQFMHIDNLEVRQWLQTRMEGSRNRVDLSLKEQVRVLTRLTDAVIFEEFIQKKFIGAKSFSLEGGESVIPLLDMAMEKAGDQGIQEVVVGMAHRGRLNVLANIMGKSPHKIFREFEDIDPKMYLGGGDVKYHKGYSGDWRTRHGQNIHISLCFNPSHLEFVNPVALGRLRAKQDRSGLASRGEKGMGLLIHGDAAFAGEGIVQETLNLSHLDGYETGGTLHLVINNQIGFTTPPKQSRSTRYCTDIAKMLQIPIFHVNGESPEAVAAVIRLAMDFRMQFKRDVVVDMYCYRRRGHNEGDEPSYTQPGMYKKIENRPSVREAYLSRLLDLGGITREDADRIGQRRTELLEKELTAARSDEYVHQPDQKFAGAWGGFGGGLEKGVDEAHTAVAKDKLCDMLQKLTTMPEGFELHPKLRRQMKTRASMADGKKPIDWSTAEALALGSLAVSGHRIRLSGQDSQRGTFSQRHAVLWDYEKYESYCPLQHLDPGQAPVNIFNSPLSEAGVLGFDYGYSLDLPSSLVMWEAQFGDFVNAAQVIIDQFITSAEDKWRRLSGIVMLLPHGFEGQGPEHSSARLERFLMLAAEDNIQVCQPTTPAQYFHLLRRQVLRRWRKPLIVMTPKSLLRHPKVASPIEDLATNRFHRVLVDEPLENGSPRKNVSRVLLCTGKVYYELVEHREKLGRDDVAILRLEQMYPFPKESLERELARYADHVPMIWVQEEPENMGAWPYLRMLYGNKFLDRLELHHVARPMSASPATGSRAAHNLEQERLMAAAFGVG